MSTEFEIYQRERVLQERSRRSSIAQLLHDRARGEDEPTFNPLYDTEDLDALDPTNLASGLGKEDMNFYTQMVRIEPPQAEPTMQAPLSSMSAPRPATHRNVVCVSGSENHRAAGNAPMDVRFFVLRSPCHVGGGREAGMHSNTRVNGFLGMQSEDIHTGA
jgi:hypothetical protein